MSKSKKLNPAEVKAYLDFLKVAYMDDKKTETTKKQWRDIAVAWLGEGQYGKYISIKAEEDILIKKGETLFLNENKFKNDNPKAPDYKKSVKNEEAAGEAAKKADDDELPF